jgi:hypothetical protein
MGKVNCPCLALGFLLFGIGIGDALALQEKAPPEIVVPSIELPVIVKEGLAKLPLTEGLVAPLKVLRFKVSGGPLPLEIAFKRLDNGLWAIAWAGGAVNQQMITLHGMFNLAGTIDIKMKLSGGIRIHHSVRKANALSGDLATLVAPTAGSRFTIEHNYDVESTSPGIVFSSSDNVKNSRIEMKSVCATDKAIEATKLHPDLKGLYIPVTCEYQSNVATPPVSQWAYLIDSRMYVRLSSGKETYTITDVEYVQLNAPETK